MGSTLKIISGTMDEEDRQQIMESLRTLNTDTSNLIDENNKQVRINKELQSQIENLKQNIENQQRYIKNNINNLILNTQIKDNFHYMKIVFQIHNDINSLLHFIDTIEDVILTSRLGILTRNILTDKENDLVRSTDEFREIKIASLIFENDIILTLLIPRFSTHIFENYVLEPLVNEKNESLFLTSNEILLDNKRNIYMTSPKDNKVKNLVVINDKCIEDIFNSAIIQNCLKIKKEPEEIIKELGFGLLIVKNLKRKQIIQNCSDDPILIEGTKIIKFENCSVNLNNQLFVNQNEIVIDHYISPGYLKRIESDNYTEALTLHFINMKTVEIRKELAKSKQKITNNNVLSHILMLIVLIGSILLLAKYLIKYVIMNNKNVPRTEALTNDGGVTVPTSTVPTVTIPTVTNTF